MSSIPNIVEKFLFQCDNFSLHIGISYLDSQHLHLLMLLCHFCRFGCPQILEVQKDYPQELLKLSQTSTCADYGASLVRCVFYFYLYNQHSYSWSFHTPWNASIHTEDNVVSGFNFIRLDFTCIGY